MLNHMNKRLHAEQTFDRAIRRILDDAIALNGADYGTLQLSWGDYLLIADQRNFKRPFLKTFRKVAKDHGSACGRALRSGKTVVIEDTELDAEFAPFRPIAREAGYRSVVTTPLLTEEEDLVGVVSTHFVGVHRPTDIEIETFEQYGVSASEYLLPLIGQDGLASLAINMNQRLCGQARKTIVERA